MLTPQFFAEQTNDGYTYTLTTRMGEILTEAQTLFGPRNLSWTPLGIEFSEDGPRIWYPGNHTHVAIQLSSDCFGDDVRACYQIAHECVHLLAPLIGKKAPVLEEGVATMFAEDYIFKKFGRTDFTDQEDYKSAAASARNLLLMYPDSIRALREIEPCFKKMSTDTFKKAGLKNISEGIQHNLLATF